MKIFYWGTGILREGEIMQDKFNWRVVGDVSVLLEYENISLYEYNTDVKSIIKAYKNGRPKMREIFGDSE